MLTAAALLGALAIVLAWPAPILLARAAWPERSPAVALALWQAIGIAGGLSMIGSLVALGLAPAQADAERDGRPGGILALFELVPRLWSGPLPEGFGVVHLAALTLAVVLGGHLLANLAVTAVAAERSRRRQHRLLELLSDPLPGDPAARVLAHPAPIAYCVPGVRTATVLTDGLVELLEPRQLRAVLAHEHAHLAGLHHLILLAFRAWHSALPWFPIANRAERAVTLLTEYLADDEAASRIGPAALRDALGRVGVDGELAAYAEAGGVVLDADMLARRLRRLDDEHAAPLAPRLRTAITVGAGVLVVAPVLVLAGVVL